MSVTLGYRKEGKDESVTLGFRKEGKDESVTLGFRQPLCPIFKVGGIGKGHKKPSAVAAGL
jgi:hypothetical protein